MRLLTRRWEKARGLLGTRSDAEPVALVGCSSVHTVGMGYPIDLAFADAHGKVLKTRRAVPPGRIVSCQGACLVLERPAEEGAWPREGEDLVLFGYATRINGGEDISGVPHAMSVSRPPDLSCLGKHSAFGP